MQNAKILHHKWKVPNENFREPLKISVSQLAIESCSYAILFYKLIAERAGLQESCIKKIHFLRFGPYMNAKTFALYSPVLWGVGTFTESFRVTLSEGSQKVPKCTGE